LRLLFDVNVSLECDESFPDLSAAVTAQVYHIAREASFNSIRHGKPRNLWLRLRNHAAFARMVVEDDGSGIGEGIDLRRTLGVRLMHHRADTVGASLEIDSAPGKGTRVVCSIPVT
jgi:signal transduction histidine kinase